MATVTEMQPKNRTKQKLGIPNQMYAKLDNINVTPFCTSIQRMGESPEENGQPKKLVGSIQILFKDLYAGLEFKDISLVRAIADQLSKLATQVDCYRLTYDIPDLKAPTHHSADSDNEKRKINKPWRRGVPNLPRRSNTTVSRLSGMPAKSSFGDIASRSL
jgi:hypothetical protein